MTPSKVHWRIGIAAAGGAILLGGCGGSVDSTTSAQPAHAGSPPHAVPAERSPRPASESSSPENGKRTLPKLKTQSTQTSGEAAKPRSRSGSPPASTAKKTADAVAEIKELVEGSGGGKQRTVSTPKQIHKVLQELQDQSGQSGDQTSGSQGSGSGGSGSGSGVEEILESLGGN